MGQEIIRPIQSILLLESETKVITDLKKIDSQAGSYREEPLFPPANREISDYFSGTGKSLAVARDLAGRPSAELVPISSVVDRGSIDIDADAVGNIELVKGRPEWLHRCENCYGCFVWCPKGEIGGEIVRYNERYHNPEVSLPDMLVGGSRREGA